MWPVLVVLLGLLAYIDVDFDWMHSVVLLCGVAFVFVIAYYFAGKKNRILEIVSRWGETSFFIYTFGNTLILWFIDHIWFRAGEPGICGGSEAAWD